MPHIDTFVAQAELHFGRQTEQTEEVGYSRTFFAYALAQRFLCEAVLLYKLAESEGYFYGVKVFALNILDEPSL